MQKSFRPLWIFAAILLITSLACSLPIGLDRNSTNTDEPPAADSEGQSGGQQDRGEEAVPTNDAAEVPESGGEEITGGSLNTGMENLSSFNMTFIMKVDGTKSDGSAVQEELSIEQRSDKAANASAMLVSGILNGTGMDNNYQLYQIGDATYMYGSFTGDDSCMYFSSADQSGVTAAEPSDFLGDFEKARLVSRGENVNGMNADHYVVEGENTFTGMVLSQADVWIDPATQMVIRYIGQGTVTDSNYLFGEEVATGTVTWEYNLTNINQPVDIALPEACESAASQTADYPIPSNATDTTTYSGFVSFSSPDTIQTVADFYRSELPAQGWTTNETMSTDSVVMIAASKDDQVINVMITSSGEGTSVVITPES
jgi:hypothetical protein